MNSLIEHINKYISLSLKDKNLILSKINPVSLKKKEVLESENTTYRNIYFVIDGCLHLYQNDENGREQTIQFAIKNWWLIDYNSFHFQSKSMYNVQAVEKSEVIAINKNDFEYLLHEIPKLERYFRFIAQRAYSASLCRISLMFSLSKEELYLNFIQRFPEFSQHVPQFILGSYLGISAEYISEIRKNQTK